jgi:hypothetical protein
MTDRAVDVAVVGVLGVLQPLVLIGAPGAASVPALVVLAVGPLPLLARRHAPRTVLACIVVAEIAFALAHVSAMAVGASVVVAADTRGTRLRRRDARPALVLTLAGHAVEFGVSGDLGGPADLVGVMIVVAAAWWLGDTLRTRREHATALEARAKELEMRTRELEEAVRNWPAARWSTNGYGSLASSTTSWRTAWASSWYSLLQSPRVGSVTASSMQTTDGHVTHRRLPDHQGVAMPAGLRVT